MSEKQDAVARDHTFKTCEKKVLKFIVVKLPELNRTLLIVTTKKNQAALKLSREEEILQAIDRRECAEEVIRNL